MTSPHIRSRALPPRASLYSAFAAATAATLAAPAYAQGAADGTSVQLAPVTVSGQAVTGSKTDVSGSAKYAVPLLDVPQTITVVPRQVLDEQNALSLRQALSNVSGITFNAGEGGGGSGDSINIRGFSANANMQVDGLRDSAQTSRSDLFNLDSVEVIKGPNSVFGGSGTTGGSINMISKQPKSTDSTEIAARLGTDRYKRLTVDTNQTLGSEGFAAFRLNLMAHGNDVPGRDQIYKRRWGVAPSLTLGMNGPTRLTLSFLHQTDDNLPDFGVPALYGKRLDGVSRESYFGWRNLDKEKIQSNALTAKLEHDFSADLKLQNLTRYSSLSRDTTVSASHVDLRGMRPGNYKPAGPQGYGRDSTTEMWVNQTNLTSKFDTFGLGHTLVTGFEISRETYDRTTYSYNINRYYPAGGFELARPPGRWDGPTSKSASARNKTSLDTKALYAMDTIALGRMFDVSLGLRYDWIDAKSSSRPVGGARLDVDSADRKLSTRVGLTFKPAENGRIYVAYGTSFNPSAEFLVTTGGGLDARNNSLAPEKNRTVELGTKWELLDQRLALGGALFQVDKTNAREALADGSYLLAGAQRVKGLELNLSGKVTPQWDVYANYTYMDSETRQSTTQPLRIGRALGNTPRNSFSLWTTYALPGGWTVGYGARAVGTRNVTSQGDGKLDAYWVHSVMASYDVNRNLKLQLNVENLTDKAYVERVRQVVGNESRSSAIEYGDGRSAMLSAIYKF